MPRPPFGICLPVLVTGVHDGDTLTVRVVDRSGNPGLVELTLRLLDCWAPELTKPREKAAGLRARDYLRKVLLGARDVALFRPLAETDNVLAAITSLGRLVARLYVGDQDVGEMLIRAGLAWRTKEELREALDA